jgi:hypothetical protein
MKRFATLGALAALALGACGDDEDGAATPAAQEPKPAVEPKDVPTDPYALTCGHIADPAASAKASRRASFTLADESGIDDRSRLQVAESMWFAMTELCKKEGDGYKPAKDALAAVKAGKYEADLGTP